MASPSNLKAISVGVLAVLGIGAGVYFFDQSRQTATEEATAADGPSIAAPTVSETSPTVATPEPGTSGVTGVAESAALPEKAAPAALATNDNVPDVDVDTASTGQPVADVNGVTIADLAPAIDTFFRNPDETTVIAGRATPGQTVAIVLGGEELDRVVVGDDGAFGAVVFISAADQPRRLRLIGDPDGQAIASAETVIVPPSAPVEVADNVVGGETPTIAEVATSDTEAQVIDDEESRIIVGLIAEGAQAPEVTSESPTGLAPEQGSTPEVSAPPTLIADAEGVRVIQPSEGAAGQPELVDNIALDTITYDTSGEVILSGRADTGGFVQIYLDNKPITTSRISDQGDWSIDLPDVDTGVYTLRVDEVDSDGNVQSRIETPFKREERETVAAIMAEETEQEGFDLAVKTVQPGNTLWAIAEERFGDGIKYVAVFEANKDQIRDPDLIYPGQVFRLPEVTEE